MRGELIEVPIENCIIEGEFNTRTKGVGDVSDLAESIKAGGIKEPLLGKDRENEQGQIEIYAGFRRLAAAGQAGLKTVPVVVQKRRSLTRKDMLVSNITENVIRKNLNPVDEARAFHRLQEEHGMSLDQVCSEVGLKKDFVSDRLTLLKLEPVVLGALQEDEISIASAAEIDRLPKDKQGKYVEVAKEFKGAKLRRMIDKVLDNIQQKIEGTGDTKPKDPDAAAVTENVRTIRKASAVICLGLGYGEDKVGAVKEVNFRALGPDDLTTVARLFDDCADQVQDDVAFNEKAKEEMVAAVNGGAMKLVDGPEFRSGLLQIISARAEEKAREKNADKPKITAAIMKETLSEFFADLK